VAGVVALVVAGAYAAARGDHPGTPGAASTGGSAPTGSSSPSPSPSPWPSTAGACGATAYRPLMNPQPRVGRIGVRLLVGGHGVRLVDADTGTARPVGGIPTDAQRTVGELVSAAGVAYVLSAECDGGARRVYRLENDTAHPVADVPVDSLLAGTARVWAVDYSDTGADPTSRVVLRLLDGGRSLSLPPGAYPVADTGAGLVVGVASPPDAASRPPRVMVLDPTTGRPVRTLGFGRPLAADRAYLLLQLLDPCDVGVATTSCTVARVDVRTGQVHGRYQLPEGRVPASAGSLSRDGRLAVFQLARAHPDPRFDTGHPGPPSDIALLHLDTGQLEIVPGLELAPKTAAGLIFAEDGSWVLATVSDGDHTHLLAWHPGLGAPQSVARLSGPVPWAPPLLIA
jgi:hypothetical protein